MRPLLAILVGALVAGCAHPAGELPSRSSDAMEDGLDGQPVSNATSLPRESGAFGGVTGVVVNDRYRPVANVTVQITPENVTVLTGQDGSFAFAGVAPGRHWVRVISQGAIVYARAIDVVAGESTQIVLQLQGPPLDVTRIGIEAKEFAFTPAASQVAYEQLPFAVHLENTGVLPHTVRFTLVCECSGANRQLWESTLEVDAGGAAELHVPVEQDGAPNVAVKTGAEWESFPAEDIRLDFEETLFGALGMTGSISLAN